MSGQLDKKSDRPEYTPENNKHYQKEKNLEDKKLYALNIWERCFPAENNHPYILRKKGNAKGLRYYPITEPALMINGINVAGYLVVPCWSNDEVQTLQFIPPNGGKKLNLRGASFNGGYFA